MTHNLKHIVKSPTCYKNPVNPSCIDLILTNKPNSFMNKQIIETGLSDHHEMTITVTRHHFPKMKPNFVTYRNYKTFDVNKFRYDLNIAFITNKKSLSYEKFENIYLNVLDKHAPCKTKVIRANEAPFMNKELKKSIMTHSRLRNRYLKSLSVLNRNVYKSQRNLCTTLLRKHKRDYFNNLDTKFISDNKKFLNAIKPLFPRKVKASQKISLINGNTIISENSEIAEVFNEFFDTQNIDDPILKAIKKYEKHPSITKINENTRVDNKFSFSTVPLIDIKDVVNSLDASKSTTYCNIPTKIFKQNFDICSAVPNFPMTMKLADVSPVHKKDDFTDKNNYRPVSILSVTSKVFERLMYRDIACHIEKYLSSKLGGFRKGYSPQLSLIIMLEEIRKSLDEKNSSGMLLTDLSKAFDCLVHDLMIAKLHAYGFDYNALCLINSFLSGRRQRTKIGTAFSKWADIILGVPRVPFWGHYYLIFILMTFSFSRRKPVSPTTPMITHHMSVIKPSIWLFHALKTIH